MITQESIDKVLLLDIETVVSDAGIKLHNAGAHKKCACPFHTDKDPSMVLYTDTNTYKCFGCGAHGDVIEFVMEFYSLTFYEAVRKLGNDYNVDIVDDFKPKSDEQRSLELHRESLEAIVMSCLRFFQEQLDSNTQYADLARVYANDRWGSDFVKMRGIGFAPNSFTALQAYAKQNSLSQELLLELGLISPKRSKEDGRPVAGYNDQQRGRIIIPIHDHLGRLVGFTGRILPKLEEQGEHKPPKYVNSATSLLYHKDETVFNLNYARKQARKEDRIYLCEGAPDVFRLCLLGHNNAVACLGSSWTDEQFKLILRHTSNIIFVPDIDPVRPENTSDPYIAAFGTGIGRVIALGQHAIELGFSVFVKDISSKEKSTGKKFDADSYFTEEASFNKIVEEDFLIWLAKKLKGSAIGSELQQIQTLARLLALIPKDDERTYYKEAIDKIFQQKKVLSDSLREARKSLTEQNLKGSNSDSGLEDRDFAIVNNHYVGSSSNGRVDWSNFIMEPLFHIVDYNLSIRLYRLTNRQNQTQIVEFKQEEIGSVDKFRNKLESFGNYLWLARMEQLLKLKLYLYDNTTTAYYVSKPGWQSYGFYAFSNGVVYQEDWYEIDEYGIVAIPGKGNFYIPALSCINKSKKTRRNSFERNFVYLRRGGISLFDYSRLLFRVYGANSMLAILFYLCSLFRDIIVAETQNYPILNLFGLTGSGKTALGKFLMAFFVTSYDPANLRTGTIPSIAETVAQSSNALVQIDEYKNDIDTEKIELLKGIWDGVGRTRMSIDLDGRREMSAVDSGVILTGQDVPNKDPALFNRVIHLVFTKNQFTPKEIARFNELQAAAKPGLSHITVELLRYRALMEKHFAASFDAVSKQLDNELKDTVERRIVTNWAIPLATFYTLQNHVQLPFKFKEALEFSIRGIRYQHSSTTSTNEVGVWWQVFDMLIENAQIFYGADFFIQKEKDIVVEGKKDTKVNLHFEEGKEILYIRFPRIQNLYQQNVSKVSDREPSKDATLRQYLKASSSFIGVKDSQRFKMFQGGVPVVKKNKRTGADCTVTKNALAYLFDYAKLKDVYKLSISKFDSTPEMDDDEDDDNE